eukprot:31823-Rhodomonas_salina.1
MAGAGCDLSMTEPGGKSWVVPRKSVMVCTGMTPTRSVRPCSKIWYVRPPWRMWNVSLPCSLMPAWSVSANPSPSQSMKCCRAAFVSSTTQG